MMDLVERAADLLMASRLTIALTGAGISVESGIPDFRSAGGLWTKYDPSEYATIEAFVSNPEKVWEMLREMGEVVGNAIPNRAHIGLGELERLGYLHFVITQNIDNLHQAGGSRNVIEYHGNASTLSCLSCGRHYRSSDKASQYPPRCECGNILKPDVIFFGEAIPSEALSRSYELAQTAQAVFVVGTSATVSPANTIPSTAKRGGATIIEINKERTHLTDTITDIFLQGSAGTIVDEILNAVKRESAGSNVRL
ncbi:MAG: RNA polymerase subunit sigma [Deltaproteobacteria bacterium CG_4_8_14_3_um_filter_51_11]|nr:NAD-dependent deacylase [bacterium]NCP10240.1 NAD-dependent deacylase [bacterium]PIP47514.1 MAG: RNA polymerase subunit sigma [Deltaproteobacteria bacterium CG23_combo_of_CG06-09_8_20_14_all_51_20]PIX20311.1 MAG: RNA polymerase subunit sigma [Deltaproteobacteria bacterium CG_4_8_14_3_um_filter_51_11]PIY26675.1 MAG: RNA polymerase subunit sigma [Deltaproteobacteria bacterium CG_4_10_14_3_um_filter_51_14]